LRRLGAVQLLDGLVGLPLDARNREQLEWLADEVAESDGDAAIWIGELASRAQERALAAEMARAIATQYEAVADDAAEAHDQAQAARRRTLARLRRELRRIRLRDYFPPPERELAQRAVEELAALEERALR